MDGTMGGARDGDWVFLTSHFYGSHKGSEKAQLLYAGCVHFNVDWLFWNMYIVVAQPLDLSYYEKSQDISREG